MADTGGYIAGAREAVELCGYRLTSPGVGLEVGASPRTDAEHTEGLFLRSAHGGAGAENRTSGGVPL